MFDVFVYKKLEKIRDFCSTQNCMNSMNRKIFLLAENRFERYRIWLRAQTLSKTVSYFVLFCCSLFADKCLNVIICCCINIVIWGL